MAQQAAAVRPEGRYVPRVKQLHQKEIVRQMMERYGYKNPMAVPRLHKIVVNMGVGEASQNIKILDAAVDQLAAIAGQRPVIRRARKSIANFKIRKAGATTRWGSRISWCSWKSITPRWTRSTA